MKYFPCQIKELKLSCWGCCGRDYKSKKEVEKDIENNTKDFELIRKNINNSNLLKFRDRLDPDPFVVKKSGICSDLVKFSSNCYACPLHPKINELVDKKYYKKPDNKDLRIGYCDHNYECITINIWHLLNKKQKILYYNYLKKQTLSHYEYSTQNIQGILIRKFLDEEKIKLD